LVSIQVMILLRFLHEGEDMDMIVRRISLPVLCILTVLAEAGCASSDANPGNDRDRDASAHPPGAGASSNGGGAGKGGAGSGGDGGGEGGASNAGGAGDGGAQSSGGRAASGGGGAGAAGDAGSECQSAIDCPQTDCFGCPAIVCIDGKCMRDPGASSTPTYSVIDLATNAVRIAIAKKDPGRGMCFRIQLGQGGAPSSLHVTTSPGWSVESAWSSSNLSDCDSVAATAPAGSRAATDATGNVTMAKDGTGACLTSVNVVLAFAVGVDEPITASFNGVAPGACS
jgi:hypothetical protein